MKRIIAFSIIVLISLTFGCVSEKNRFATIVTEKGTIKFELYEKEAPITTKNFIELAQKGFYDGLIFHRVDRDSSSRAEILKEMEQEVPEKPFPWK